MASLYEQRKVHYVGSFPVLLRASMRKDSATHLGEVIGLARCNQTSGTVLALRSGLAFAIAGYFNRSSNAAWVEFLDAAGASESSASMEPAGRTGCPQGKRELPTQLLTDPE